MRGTGTQFSVHAPDADLVQVCLISPDGAETRIDLVQRTYGIWHGVVDGVGPGQRYGYRVHGEWNPRAGVRMNPAKLLVDPWAKRITGGTGDHRALISHAGDPFGEPSPLDSLGHAPLSVVTPAVPGPPVPGSKGPGRKPSSTNCTSARTPPDIGASLPSTAARIWGWQSPPSSVTSFDSG